jgi:hypothetical protein
MLTNFRLAVFIVTLLKVRLASKIEKFIVGINKIII